MGIVRTTAENFFSQEEREQIRRAIVEAESTTSGEIVPLVVDRSDPYPEAELAAALVLSSLAGLLLILLLGHDSVWWYLPMVLLSYGPVRFLVGRLPFLSLPFITRGRMSRAVRDRALRAFYERGLHRTAGETGVLIYISLFERRVWILGDRGINERIPHDAWQEMVDTLTTGIRQGEAGSACCRVIARCGSILQAHFPVMANDTNELRDDLLTG